MPGYDTHKFFCLYCGKAGIPLARKIGKQKKGFQRKKLYCYHCQNTVNHIECRTTEEVEIFKTEFAKGVYENEAKESLDFVRGSRIGQIYMGSQASR